MKNYLPRAIKIQQKINELASLSENQHFLKRSYGSPSFMECSRKITSWMKEAGLEINEDLSGNITGRFAGRNAEFKTMAIVSYFETLPNGGKYDGVLGIIMGLDLLENFQAKKTPLPINIELVALSKQKQNSLSKQQSDGAELSARKLPFSPFDWEKNYQPEEEEILLFNEIPPGVENSDKHNWMACLEIHIDKGPVLSDQNIPIGVVNAVAGHKKIAIRFTGETGYIGSVPMHLRKDALCAAAKFISAVEKYASRGKRNIIATVGEISIPESTGNLIPGNVSCTLDISGDDADLLSDAYENINALCEKICDKRNIYFEWRLVQDIPPRPLSKKLRKLLAASIVEKKVELAQLVNGTGNGIPLISGAFPTALLEVRGFKRISHPFMDDIETEDIAIALEVAEHFIQQLAIPTEKISRKK